MTKKRDTVYCQQSVNGLDCVWKEVDQQLSNGQDNSLSHCTALRSDPEPPVTSGDPSVWQQYRRFVRNHHGTLQLWDEAVTRILFWAPHSSGDSRWREVLYGLLSLHRTAMDMAFQDRIPQNPYGTTLKVQDSDSTHATAIRVALTVIHGLMPAMLEVSRSGRSGRNAERAQSTARLHVERVKFVLRVSLLVSFWRKIFRVDHDKDDDEKAVVPTGVLRAGGMYCPYEDGYIPSMEDEYAQWRRRQYVGRRTGRQLGRAAVAHDTNARRKMWLVIGELLHVCRPLYWSHAERKHAHGRKSPPDSLWIPWIAALGIDLASFRCLTGLTSSETTREEMQRRKIRILLCLLRAPAWERLSQPTAQQTLAVVDRIPVIGRLLATYLWDLLTYWKHPFFLEEG